MRDIRPLATRQEVADHIGVPVRTLESWAYRGTGPRYVLCGRHARYRWVDVEAWLEQNAQGAA